MHDRLKPALFAVCLLPAVSLIVAAIYGGLGANPIETITHTTGDWTLNFLLITLAMSPLRTLTRQNRWLSIRRMLGLYAFFYACLHFSTYLVLDQFFDWHEILNDIGKRPFITVGFTAYLMLIPLAATSTKKMVQKLGRNWHSLHRLIYLIAIFGVVHYLWLVKADLRPPLSYATVLLLLLCLRLPRTVSLISGLYGARLQKT